MPNRLINETSPYLLQHAYNPVDWFPWNEKALGKAFGMGSILGVGYKRQTFLVLDGKIAWRDLSAKPKSQSADVMQALKELTSKD